MNLEDIKNYCLKKEGTKINFPFDDKTLTFIVGGKMFLLTDINAQELKINLKCNPDLALFLRENYEAVIPGYHMNKKHWNTVCLGKDLPSEKIYELIDHSYELVFGSLTKKEKEKIKLFGKES